MMDEREVKCIGCHARGQFTGEQTMMAARMGDRIVVGSGLYSRLRGMGYEDLMKAIEVIDRPGLHPDTRAWVLAAFLSWATAPDHRSCLPVQESLFVEPERWIIFRGGQLVAMGRLKNEEVV